MRWRVEYEREGLELTERDVMQGRITPLWKEVERFLRDRIEMHQQAQQSAQDIRDVRFSAGVIANCKDLLALPEWFIEILTDETEEPTREEVTENA